MNYCSEMKNIANFKKTKSSLESQRCNLSYHVYKSTISIFPWSYQSFETFPAHCAPVSPITSHFYKFLSPPHTFIPPIIIKTVLVPILKKKLKPATESDNYRPIAIATAISKLLELIILNKCNHLLSTTPNQFGFKKAHSTDLCIFSLN